MERRAWWAKVHGVAKSWTRLSDLAAAAAVAAAAILSFIFLFFWFETKRVYCSVVFKNKQNENFKQLKYA